MILFYSPSDCAASPGYAIARTHSAAGSHPRAPDTAALWNARSCCSPPPLLLCSYPSPPSSSSMSGHCPDNRLPGKMDMSCIWGKGGTCLKLRRIYTQIIHHMYSHLRLAGIAMVKLRVDILHLIVLLLPGNCKTSRKEEAINYQECSY